MITLYHSVNGYEQVLPKAMLNKPPENEELIREEKKSIAEVRAILATFLKPDTHTEGVP